MILVTFRNGLWSKVILRIHKSGIKRMWDAWGTSVKPKAPCTDREPRTTQHYLWQAPGGLVIQSLEERASLSIGAHQPFGSGWSVASQCGT